MTRLQGPNGWSRGKGSLFNILYVCVILRKGTIFCPFDSGVGNGVQVRQTKTQVGIGCHGLPLTIPMWNQAGGPASSFHPGTLQDLRFLA